MIISYYHNKFSKVGRTDIYQFIRSLEQDLVDEKNIPFGWVYGDEFRKLRQIINFAYTHGFREDNV